MYSFEPNEEQQMLVDAVGKYANNDLRPAAHDAEEGRELPKKLVSKGWEIGLLQASIPEAYGGFGERSAVTGALAVEEMAFGDLAGALAVMTPSLFATPILLAGSEEQKQEFLSKVIEGDWSPYTAALIEYAFDFDANDLRTIAKADGSDYVLSGEKAFVPYAKDAEAILVYANLDGMTQGFIVPKGAAGLSVSEEREMLMSLNALPMYRVKLDNVKVSASSRLGGASGHNFELALASMRIASASAALGVAKASLEYATTYAKEREAFGVKIAQKQAIAFMLAEMATEIEAIRLLTWEAAWMLDTGNDEAVKQAYLAFTGAADMVMMVTDRGVQILGGHGYIREHPVEMWMRNGRGFAMLTGLAIV
ncbi:acyl-CoA dehydrogenase family protein [Candidatus Villigracilis saccharophilus]|uniref:acyl-CoA dehydrogenase family protein n=1 Tax=Candidatus Villigracilis saccharophilus TaxID=3140684 RepID=UPI0031364874|nr:acyl-CoA dehydrogenase family protein [Anaerolineales bacterium]